MVLKKPDSSFSLGVVKVASAVEYERELDRLFRESALLIAQEYVPTLFDWRVGILDRQPLYVCRYHMAGKHWQIIDHSKRGVEGEGRHDTWPVDAAPSEVVKAAIKAANLIGDGLYGVDVKEINGRPLVVEINDNPSLDAGVEDAVLGEELYLRIMRSFLHRLESRGR
jgi:glutathione synthase/RimK-type ligase-like ATP-grasp enzyme